MKCPICKADTKIRNTQTDHSDHPLPVDLKGLGIIRRRRVCFSEDEHKFWTIEALEEVWQQHTGRI